MQQLTIPRIGDEVEYFLTYDGDEEVSGPFTALVLGVDIEAKPFPRLDLRICFPFEHMMLARSVPYRSGRHYWLMR